MKHRKVSSQADSDSSDNDCKGCRGAKKQGGRSEREPETREELDRWKMECVQGEMELPVQEPEPEVLSKICTVT